MKLYEIYYADPDFACETGNPCLGKVEADNKEDAERIAMDCGMGGVAGAWAVECEKPDHRNHTDN